MSLKLVAVYVSITGGYVDVGRLRHAALCVLVYSLSSRPVWTARWHCLLSVRPSIHLSMYNSSSTLGCDSVALPIQKRGLLLYPWIWAWPGAVTNTQLQKDAIPAPRRAKPSSCFRSPSPIASFLGHLLPYASWPWKQAQASLLTEERHMACLPQAFQLTARQSQSWLAADQRRTGLSLLGPQEWPTLAQADEQNFKLNSCFKN